MSRRLAIVVLGAPGAGKGTLTSRLCTDLGLAAVATGDILRRTKPNTVQRGELVADATVNAAVRTALAKSLGAVVMDGYPRTARQAAHLDTLADVSAFLLNVPDALLLKRFAKRWIHPSSGRTYHTDYKPPKTPFADDITGEPLVQRDDDALDVAQNRLALFRTSILPDLTKYYATRLCVVRGTTSDDIYKVLRPLVLSFLKPAV